MKAEPHMHLNLDKSRSASITVDTPPAGARARPLLLALLGAFFAVLACAPSAFAYSQLGEPGEGAGQISNPSDAAVDIAAGRLYVADDGNHRIDAFDADTGAFEFAWGWGVEDGSAELQTCTTASTCRMGLSGNGAGEFASIDSIAVDNDPGSSSYRAVYVSDASKGPDGAGARVQKFTPTGEFLLAFGGGVITGGASGTGLLSSGSTTVTNLMVTKKAFEAGQTITGTGIPAGTKIVAVGSTTLTLSKAATINGSVVLNVAEGAGNVPVNEVQELPVVSSATSGEYDRGICFVNSLSEDCTKPLLPGASAAFVQEELEHLTSIGTGNVAVTGPDDGPYLVEFTGRYADTNVNSIVSATSGGGPGFSPLGPTRRNGASGAEICVAGIAAACAGGVIGGGAGQLGSGEAPLAVGPNGVVYVGESFLLSAASFDGEFARGVKEFDSSGAYLGKAVALPPAEGGSVTLRVSAIAVDGSGDIYALMNNADSTSEPEVHKFAPDGNLLTTFGRLSGSDGLALDPAGNVFVGWDGKIEEYDSTGTELLIFGYGEQLGPIDDLVPFISPAGDIFIVRGGSAAGAILYRFLPEPAPIILPEAGLVKASSVGNTKATLQAVINPEGKQTTYYFEYVDAATYAADLAAGGAGHGFDHATRVPGDPAEDPVAGSDFTEHTVSTTIGCQVPQQPPQRSCLTPETEYRFRVFAENADGKGNSPLEGAPFTTKAPMDGVDSSATEVGSETATLSGELNPLGIPASGYLQYVDDATYQRDLAEFGPGHGFDHAISVPDVGAGAEPLDFGASEVPTSRSLRVGSLQSNTLYHHRLIASNAYVTKTGPEHAFRTFGNLASGLPDGRGYELVSPALKNSAELGAPGPASGEAFFSVKPMQASVEGNAITYPTATVFGASPESAPAVSQYLSTREPAGWSTDNINPRFEEGYLRDPVVGFSKDLARAIVIAIEPPLTPDAMEGFPNIYLRDNVSGTLRALTTKANTPEINIPKYQYCVSYGGASTDFSRIFFAAAGALIPGASSKDGFNLYEWSASRPEGEKLRLVSVLPNKGTARASFSTGFGRGNDVAQCNMAGSVARHAVSADGSRVFWTYGGGEPPAAPRPLFARVNGSETVQIDAPNQGEGIEGKGGEGVFWDASVDGSRVFFTDSLHLTGQATAASSSAEPDLYVYDFGAPAGKRLTNLTADATEAASVQKVIGASADGSYVYFTAAGVLDHIANGEGESASPGGRNLYAWHDGTTRFIANLSTAGVGEARVTADGRHLAFLSDKSITGYENDIAGGFPACALTSEDKPEGGRGCSEAYLYDAEEDALACASCNPSGARPLGPPARGGMTSFPTWSTPYEQPRFLSDDGDRLLFQTRDALAGSRDTNGQADVYQWEAPGTGSCKADSPTFHEANGGCLDLISTGTSSDDSYLLDASFNGNDIFFSTRQALVPEDEDERYDVYDARVGGGFPAGPRPNGCDGESCRGPATAADPPLVAGSMTFQGRGSRAHPARHCRKGKRLIRRSGKARCVKKARKHKQRRDHK
jgi:hypothetical protein